MPLPLKPSNDGSDNPFVLDYSVLLNQLTEKAPSQKITTASNKDASLIMDLWIHAERAGDADTFKVGSDTGVSEQDISRLKAKGFLSTVEADTVRLTDRGKIIVTTMVLAEPNKFSREQQPKKYTEILASMSKQNKTGYRIPHYAASQSNLLRLS